MRREPGFDADLSFRAIPFAPPGDYDDAAESVERDGYVARGAKMVLANAYADGRNAARYGRRCLPLVAQSGHEVLIAWKRGYDDQRAEDSDVQAQGS